MSLDALIRSRQVLVCCGAGGVGKTTTAAALGVVGARAGRRTLVLTIDPARRLMQALGLQAHAKKPVALGRAALAALDVPAGALDAWMLDPAAVFDDLVRRLARDDAQARSILDSRLYGLLSELVAGMQEYTAAEALYSLSESKRYDLVVLDTPPSRNALDFLDAPGRLSRFLDERILNLFLPSGSRRGALWKKASELIGNVFGRVFGQAFFDEMQQFLGAFGGMFLPMRAHADEVRRLLASERSAFLLVTSPDQAAIAEAEYFHRKLQEMRLPFAGLILNRSWAADMHWPRPSALALPGDAPAALRSGLTKLEALADEELARQRRDRALLDELRGRFADGGLAVAAPYVGAAIEDLSGLGAFARDLVADR